MNCPACHRGSVAPLARPGRWTRYKSLPRLEIPADLALPTCDACGEEWLMPRDAARLDIALDQAYRHELLRRARAVLPPAKDAARVERDLGLSQGYLSRIRKGKVPSADLVVLLAILHRRPETLQDIEAFWAMDDGGDENARQVG